MKNLSEKVNTLLFGGFLGVFALCGLLLPDKECSEMENRTLEQTPQFSLSALFDGTYADQTETHLADQFVLRDASVAAKTAMETLVGRHEFNGVYLADGRLIERIDEPEEERLAANIQAVHNLGQTFEVPVTLALAPTAASVYADTLPKGAPSADQDALLSRIYDACGVQTVDLTSALSAHKDEYIFYRTDHHWTSLGAYYGAEALLSSLGLEGKDLADLTPERVTEDFNGTLFSSSGVRTVQPDAIDLYVPQGKAQVESWRTGAPEEGTLYDLSYLEKKDKYSMFLGGNQPLCIIRTGNPGGKLLLVRYSYADSLAPFLLDSFSEIHLFDARYFKQPLTSYVQQNDIDQVVLLFSLKNFLTDTDLQLVCK